MSGESFELRIERIFDAPRSRVWRAWTEPACIRRWLSPADGWSVRAEVDLRPGGTYRWEFAPPQGSGWYETGVFHFVEAPERLAYACRFGALPDTELHQTRVALELHDLGEKTRLWLVQSGYPTRKDRDEQEAGWPKFLDHLARELARGM
jgi:uncharacterized protein YndB with AHSA1/START domain